MSDTQVLTNSIKSLIAAGNRLAFAAQTTGGTAGRDEELVRHIAEWRVEVEKARAMNRIVKYEPSPVSLSEQRE